MESQAKLDELARDFLARLEPKLPAEKVSHLFIVATIGLVGSGRTTVARKIAESLPGAVLAQANSARYLLREVANLGWGPNVREILRQVGQKLLARGYAVIFDGNASDVEDRANIQEVAQSSGAKIFYVRLIIDPELAKVREKEKYDDPDWISSFENYRVNTTEKMLANIDVRAELHRTLKSADIPGLVREIDNNGSKDELWPQVTAVVEKIQAAL